nr:hypothetical protein [Tanacetum cinerariifolium]
MGIDNDIYSIVDACPTTCEMWKEIKRLKQVESINVQDLEINLYWEFGKLTSRDVDACPTTCEMSKAIKRLKQVESINVQDLEINLYWEFGKLTSRDEQADWRDDTDDEPNDYKLEAHYLYMAKIQEVTPDATDNSGPIINIKPLQKVQYDNDNYNVFANDKEHPEQPEYVHDIYLEEQGDTNITID